MSSPTVTAGGRSGCIFEGEIEATYCFVPRECITGEGEELRVAEIDYVHTGWDVRNMRYNNATDGKHLFPNAHRPVTDLSSEAVRVFLDRIRAVRPA